MYVYLYKLQIVNTFLHTHRKCVALVFLLKSSVIDNYYNSTEMSRNMSISQSNFHNRARGNQCVFGIFTGTINFHWRLCTAEKLSRSSPPSRIIFDGCSTFRGSDSKWFSFSKFSLFIKYCPDLD